MLKESIYLCNSLIKKENKHLLTNKTFRLKINLVWLNNRRELKFGNRKI